MPAAGTLFDSPKDNDIVWKLAPGSDERDCAGRIRKHPSARSRRDDKAWEVEIPPEPSANAKGLDTILNDVVGLRAHEHLQWHSEALAQIPTTNKRAKKTDALAACFCTGVERLRAHMKSKGTLKEVDDACDGHAPLVAATFVPSH